MAQTKVWKQQKTEATNYNLKKASQHLWL